MQMLMQRLAINPPAHIYIYIYIDISIYIHLTIDVVHRQQMWNTKKKAQENLQIRHDFFQLANTIRRVSHMQGKRNDNS